MNLRQIFPLAIVFGGLGLWIDPAPVLAQDQTTEPAQPATEQPATPPARTSRLR